MSFYLKPPRGFTNFHILEECVSERLICYKNVSLINNRQHCEYLIEDSTLDRTGHYILRLAAFSNPIFKNLFIEKETELLQERFKYLSGFDSVKFFFKKLRQHATECYEQTENWRHQNLIKQYYFILVKVCTQLLRKDIIHQIAYHCSETSKDLPFVFSVPFQFCPDLVSQRAVLIQFGYIKIKYTEWKILFVSLFKTYLELSIKVMKNSSQVHRTLEDERIKDIIELVNIKQNLNNNGINKSEFNLHTIKENSKMFPLCMQNLFDTLEKNNRLSHNARFYFSLYLKSIGMSMQDSLTFWENAYSKEHSSCSKCTHSWQQNDKKYIYGIRHLYGLEGARRNYEVKSCHFMQGLSLGASEEGGCPFSHFDDIHLRCVLKKHMPNSVDLEVIINTRKKHPMEACKAFLRQNMSLEVSNLENLAFYNPAEYYSVVKHLSKLNNLSTE